MNSNEIKSILNSVYGKHDWKRVKKYKTKTNIVRIFFNEQSDYKVVTDITDTNIISHNEIKYNVNIIHKMSTELFNSNSALNGVSLVLSDYSSNRKDAITQILRKLKLIGSTYDFEFTDNNVGKLWKVGKFTNFYNAIEIGKKDIMATIGTWKGVIVRISVGNYEYTDKLFSKFSGYIHKLDDYREEEKENDIKISKDAYKNSKKKDKAVQKMHFKNGFYFGVSEEMDYVYGESVWTVQVSSSDDYLDEYENKSQSDIDDMLNLLESLGLEELLECTFINGMKSRKKLIKLLEDNGFTYSTDLE